MKINLGEVMVTEGYELWYIFVHQFLPNFVALICILTLEAPISDKHLISPDNIPTGTSTPGYENKENGHQA